MSDTTTITAKERAAWRRYLIDGTNPTYGRGLFYTITPRLLNSLEQAEARAEKAEAERKKDLAHCKSEFDRAEKAEAKVARLTKMVDWLAKALVERGHFIGDISSISIAENWKEAARRAVANAESEGEII